MTSSATGVTAPAGASILCRGGSQMEDSNEGPSSACNGSESEFEMRIRSDERDRITRKLQSSVTELLVSLNFRLEQLRQVPPTGTEQGLAAVVTQLETIFTELHGSVRALAQSPGGSANSLVDDLRVMTREFEHQTGIAVRADFGEMPMGIPPAVARALYRVGQEALANACRHGKASQVRFSLIADRGSLVLNIADDGVGFAGPAAGPFRGRGIANMSARMAELGGSFAVRNVPVGAMVEAKIDLGS